MEARLVRKPTWVGREQTAYDGRLATAASYHTERLAAKGGCRWSVHGVAGRLAT